MNIPVSSKWHKAMRKGQNAFQKGSLDAAVRFFSTATKISPQQSEGWINLGVALTESKKLTAAVNALDKAIEINPGISIAHTATGDAHRLLGNLDKSFVAYQKAVAIERTPVTLNKFGCVLRMIGKLNEAEAVHKEALRMNPGFTLARLNLATLQAELQRFDEAREQLATLNALALNASELKEVNSTGSALDQYFMLRAPLEHALKTSDLVPLRKTLEAIPPDGLRVDEGIIEGLHRYAESAKNITTETNVVLDSSELPEDWPLIEVLSKSAFCASESAYLEFKRGLANGDKPVQDVQDFLNLEEAVRVARTTFEHLKAPVASEMYIRYWHALATRDMAGKMPGHFKLTRNLIKVNSTQRRAEPHLVVGTMRYFFSEIYSNLPAGLPRGLVCLMAICDIHPFVDGNGRVARILLNRELERTNQMPFMASENIDFGKKYGAAIREVRRLNGDVSALIPVISEAQAYARGFCANLSAP